MAEEFGAPNSSLDAPANVGPDNTPVSGTIFINDLAYGTTEKVTHPAVNLQLTSWTTSHIPREGPTLLAPPCSGRPVPPAGAGALEPLAGRVTQGRLDPRMRSQYLSERGEGWFIRSACSVWSFLCPDGPMGPFFAPSQGVGTRMWMWAGCALRAPPRPCSIQYLSESVGV
jgi:hypothetical protein